MARGILIVALWVGLCAPAGAAIINTTAAQSIHIRSDAATTNQNGDTDFEDLIGGNGTADTFRALYQFSLAPLINDVNTIGGGNFANLNISSVTLTLYERRDNNAGTHPLSVHTYGFNFVESVSTWNDPDGNGNAGTGDTTAGGTVGSALTTASYSFTAGIDTDSVTFPSSASFITALSTAAQGDGTLELMVRKTGASTNFVSFASDEYSNVARQPTLSINYTVTPVPEPGKRVLLAGVLVSVPLLRRKLR